ncbi:MAG: phosphotransferase system enzyme I (PtsI), partial [Pseudomonadales bacterium]
LSANIEIEEDIKALKRVNADGVGLYRTEFLYMNRDSVPTEQEHFKVYTRVLRALKGETLTIRTADLGADKNMDGQPSLRARPLGHNPAMGLRGIRLCLSDQSLFLPQLRAILRASARGPIKLLIPMLTNITEVDQCLKLIEQVKQKLRDENIEFDEKLPVGAMIEVPAAAITAVLFAQKLDFLSIGTNDLIQYTLAIDRIDDQVNYLYDPMHPAVLHLIKTTIEAGQKCNIPVTLCGEMAGDSRYVRVLLGLGLTEFSMPPNLILETKRSLIAVRRATLKKQVNVLLNAGSRKEQQALLDKINASAPKN